MGFFSRFRFSRNQLGQNVSLLVLYLAMGLLKSFEGNVQISCSFLYETFYWLRATTTGKDRTPSIIERILRQYDLTIYEAAIKPVQKVS
jgi:hypothetical protein